MYQVFILRGFATKLLFLLKSNYSLQLGEQNEICTSMMPIFSNNALETTNNMVLCMHFA